MLAVLYECRIIESISAWAATQYRDCQARRRLSCCFGKWNG